jgi:ATP-dependent helicase HepA
LTEDPKLVGIFITHEQFGPGQVVQFENHRIMVKFFDNPSQPITFGPDGAKLIKRYRLNPGSICLFEGLRCSVEKIEKADNGGISSKVVYCIRFDDGLTKIVPETDLSFIERSAPSTPKEKLYSGALDKLQRFHCRENLVRNYSLFHQKTAGLSALGSCRIDLKAHQAYVAASVLQDPVRRYILADEVGLGKTIEAGIILHDLLRHDPRARVLIICPSSLSQQWFIEMYSKFGRRIFHMLDLYGIGDADPENQQLVISSYTAIEHYKEELSGNWDLIIVDEVHNTLKNTFLFEFLKKLTKKIQNVLLLSAIPARTRKDEYYRLLSLLEPNRYDPDDTTQLSDFEGLLDNQLKISRRLRRLRVRVEDLEQEENKKIQGVPEPDDENTNNAKSLLDKQKAVKAVAVRLLEFPQLENDPELISLVENLGGTGARENGEKIIRHIAENYRINRRILKNRRNRLIELNLIRKVNRVSKLIPYPLDDPGKDVEDKFLKIIKSIEMSDCDPEITRAFSRLALQSLTLPETAADFLGRLKGSDSESIPEDFYFRNNPHLEQLSYADFDNLLTWICAAVRKNIDDSLLTETNRYIEPWLNSKNSHARITCLIDLLQNVLKTSNDARVLIFVGYPRAAAYLENTLRKSLPDFGINCFFEDMERDAKEKAVDDFRELPAPQILVSDESGGEGRNFQFATALVHFDTPWSVSSIEQRIGRLDRLTREDDVISFVIYADGSIEEQLINCFNIGFDVYQQSISGLEFALREIENNIINLAVSGDFESLMAYSSQISSEAEGERIREDQEAIYDEASFDASNSSHFLSRQFSEEDEQNLGIAFSNYLNEIGGSSKISKIIKDQDFPDKILRITPDDIGAIDVQISDRRQDGLIGSYTGTFVRNVLNHRPNLDLFAPGHAMFDAILSSVKNDLIGRTYGITCSMRDQGQWTGFEFHLRPCFSQTGDVKISPGILNRAEALFEVSPYPVFLSRNGEELSESSAIYKFRRKLGSMPEMDPRFGRELNSGEIFEAIDTEMTQALFSKAESIGFKYFENRLGPILDREIAVVDKRIAMALGQKDDYEFKVNTELRDLLGSWTVEVDAVGLLAINSPEFQL